MVLLHKQVCDLILYEMYWFFAQPDAGNQVPTQDVFSALIGQTSETFVNSAIERLVDEEYVDFVGQVPGTYCITASGISRVEHDLDDPDSYLFDVHAERNSDRRSRIPASNRFVDLDHNSQNYADAIRTGEELIEAIKTSNIYGDSEVEEKETHLAGLDSGYRLLRAPRVDPTTVKVVLGSILTYLAVKFADEPIGELAAVAWSALKNLLGI